MLENIDISLFKVVHFYLKNDFFDFVLPYCRNKLTWIPLYLYLAFYLWKKWNVESMKIILGTIVTIIVSDMLCAKLLKEFFERIRPCQFFYLESWFSDFHLCSQTYSFPSCHASNHAAIVSFLFPYISSRLRWILCLWVGLIGYSQIYIGVHYPSDILGGIIIGSSLGYLSQKSYSLNVSIFQS